MKRIAGLCVMLGTACQGSDLARIKEIYRGILQSEDDNRIPSAKELVGQEMEGDLKALTAEERYKCV